MTLMVLLEKRFFNKWTRSFYLNVGPIHENIILSVIKKTPFISNQSESEQTKLQTKQNYVWAQ